MVRQVLWLKAVTFTVTIPKYIASTALGFIDKKLQHSRLSCVGYGEVAEPTLPGDDWVKVRTAYAGICGSDLNMVYLHDSPILSPFASEHFVMGHENSGTIVEVGKAVEGFSVGDRIVADIMLPCVVRGVEPCPSCKRGQYNLCRNFESGQLAPGTLLGTCATTGGSWGEYYVAHKSQLVRIPNNIDDKTAVVSDAVGSALHPVIRNMPGDDEQVLVIGVGIIGLMVIASLRALGSKAHISVFARHSHQAELAKRYGADVVMRTGMDKGTDTLSVLARMTGGKVLKPMLGQPYLLGGFHTIFDCVGSQKSIIDALRVIDSGGTLVLVGLPTVVKMDWSLLWFKEATLRTSYCYGNDQWDGVTKRTIVHSLELLSQGLINAEGLVSHTYPLSDYREAIITASSKSTRRAIKVLLKP